MAIRAEERRENVLGCISECARTCVGVSVSGRGVLRASWPEGKQLPHKSALWGW